MSNATISGKSGPGTNDERTNATTTQKPSEPSLDPDEGEAYSQLSDACRALERRFPFFFEEKPTGENSEVKMPKSIVIALDEAQCLTTRQDTQNLKNEIGWLPSHMFCRAVSNLSVIALRAPIWVLFASTTSRVGDFVPPSKLRE